MGNRGLSNGDIFRKGCQEEIERNSEKPKEEVQARQTNGSTVEPTEVSAEISTLGPMDAGKALFWGTFLPPLAIRLFGVPEGYARIVTVSGFPAVAICLAWSKGLSLKTVFHVNRVRNPDYGYFAILGVGLVSFELLLMQGINWLLGGRLTEWLGLLPSHDMPDSLVGSILLIAVLVPIAEELLFRGFCVTAFSQWGFGWAVMFPSIIFALSHHPVKIAGAFVMAVLAAISLIHYQSVIPAVLMHAASNLFVRFFAEFHQLAESPLSEVFCVGIRLVFVALVFVFRSRLAWLWHEFRRLWSEFTEKPQFGVRFKTLLKNWSWILIFILLGISVLGTVLVSISGKPS